MIRLPPISTRTVTLLPDPTLCALPIYAAGKHIKVPMPGRNLPPEQVAEARGFADSFALKLRHHNAAIHARGAPSEPVARAVYDAVEQARVEAIGSRQMLGVAANLNEALILKMRSDPIS